MVVGHRERRDAVVHLAVGVVDHAGAPLAVDGHRDLAGHERVVVAELVAERRAVLLEPGVAAELADEALLPLERRLDAGSFATLDLPSAVKYVGDHCAAKWVIVDS